ncbi:lipopolysaccharide biosynthesis protein [Bacteroides faecalis]|uniref:Lipopolysaccharide biosynthesis protein n=1 Tax=Bacteroides faecalis TaxID=2447885 RepID=A0A401LPI2_9BACE|nr:lipopolysaccharide biosynthesis protein [Bacteroides faecalis]GCB33456.1 lipopolysaccharide biosynthesis protein [Bacteroides faecalis]GCB37853.1 lipopolysaccharide biosynthesis protein [Bacteroides faecalis]
MPEPSLKQKAAKGIFWGGFSSGLQQLLSALFGIVIARLLDNTDYGMYGVLAIFIAIASTLQDSGFVTALVNKRSVTQEDYNAVFWCSLSIGTSIYIIFFFCAPLIADFFNAPELIWLSRYVFLGFLMSSTSVVHNAYFLRNLMIKQRAMAQLPALILSGTIGIIMAYNGMSYWGIATQNLVYIATINLWYWYFSPWRPTFHIDFRPLKGIFGFSSKILVTSIFQQINNNLVSTILGAFYTKAEVGNYTQSSKWNYMGYNAIEGMISSVAQPVLREVADDPERQQNVFRKMLRFTSFLSFPAMFGLALIAKEFIIITITDKWISCVPILQILCVWGAFMPVISLYSRLILSKEKPNIFMWNSILLCVLQLIIMLLAYPYGIHVMLMLFVVLNIIWLGVWQYFIWQEIHLSLWNALKDTVPFAGIAAATMVATYYMTIEINNIYLMLITKIGLAVAIYSLIMWFSKVAIFKESLKYLSGRSKK